VTDSRGVARGVVAALLGGFFMSSALLLSLAGAGSARAGGEHLTTWRAGDPVGFRFACQTAAALLDLDDEGYARPGAPCWVATGGAVPAVLLERVSGPHTVPQGVGSVWRARDVEGDEVFLLLCDDCGPHAASEVAL